MTKTDRRGVPTRPLMNPYRPLPFLKDWGAYVL